MYPEDILDKRDTEHFHAIGSMATELAAAAHEANGAKTLEESIPAHDLEEFQGIFEKKDFNKLQEHRGPRNQVETQSRTHERVKYSLVCTRASGVGYNQRTCRNWMYSTLKIPLGFSLLCMKKEGKLRPMQDYWKLNSLTIKNR
jgi:hypothetical protein